MSYRLVLSRRGPARGEVGEKQAWLAEHLDEALEDAAGHVRVHAGDLLELQPLVRPGDVVVEDAVDGVKRKRIRQALDAFESLGVHILSTAQVLSRVGRPLEGLGAGDSKLLFGVLDDADWEEDLAVLDAEVDWQRMFHRGGEVPRDIAIQATLEHGRVPVYRHPADEQPPTVAFTPLVDRLRQRTEALLGQTLNHCLVQRYVDGSANISLHADKTIDVLRGSSVVNVSLGATRTMVLRDKRDRETQRIDLPHGSVFVLGWRTNRLFQHGIHPDRRTEREKRRDERRGSRISLTFRSVATYLEQGRLVGQGAGPNTDRRALLDAFGQENRDPEFDWDRWYGEGWSTW